MQPVRAEDDEGEDGSSTDGSDLDSGGDEESGKFGGREPVLLSLQRRILTLSTF